MYLFEANCLQIKPIYMPAIHKFLWEKMLNYTDLAWVCQFCCLVLGFSNVSLAAVFGYFALVCCGSCCRVSTNSKMAHTNRPEYKSPRNSHINGNRRVEPIRIYVWVRRRLSLYYIALALSCYRPLSSLRLVSSLFSSFYFAAPMPIG